MNKLNINIIAVLFSLILCAASVQAQAQDQGNKGLTNYRSFWNNLAPRYVKAQFAGSIGVVSVGGGWNYGNDHWETDALLGLVPKNADRHAMVTFTLKQNYLPWKVDIDEDFYFEPLNCGIFLNTLLDSDFWVKNPDKYPNGYYQFSTKIRFHLFMGERITYKLKRQDKLVKSVSLFYELSTSDLYLINAATNSYLKPKDYLSLAFGVKLQFF